jgi:hypothetical protein
MPRWAGNRTLDVLDLQIEAAAVAMHTHRLGFDLDCRQSIELMLAHDLPY